jgi:hypothetical protein
MLEYEEDRTEGIVKRLVDSAGLISELIIVHWIIGGGVIGCLLVGLAIKGAAGLVTGCLVGGLAGYWIGKAIAGVAVVQIEWQAQMLVGLENTLVQTKRRSP